MRSIVKPFRWAAAWIRDINHHSCDSASEGLRKSLLLLAFGLFCLGIGTKAPISGAKIILPVIFIPLAAMFTFLAVITLDRAANHFFRALKKFSDKLPSS